MRVLVISLVAAGVLAGCNKGNNDAFVRINPNLPDPLKVQSLHLGNDEGFRFVTIATERGSSYTLVKRQDSNEEITDREGFYRYDLASKNKQSIRHFKGFQFHRGAMTSAVKDGLVQFDRKDGKIEFKVTGKTEGLANRKRSVEQQSVFAAPYYSSRLIDSTFASRFDGQVIDAHHRSQSMQMTIAPDGTVTGGCKITGTARRYENAPLARITFNIPASNGCGLKSATSMLGVLFYDGGKVYLMADQRQSGTQTNTGIYSSFTPTTSQ